MKREDILNQSRTSGQDEGMEQAENQGRKIGYTVFCCVFAVIVLFNFIFGRQQDTLFYAVSAMFWAFLAAEAFPKYKFTGKRTFLVTTIAGGLASFAFLLNYILTTLGLI